MEAASSSEALLPDWSDDESEQADVSLQPLPPSPLGPIAFRRRLEEYRSIIYHLEYQQTADLTHSLANRAHLEHLVERYWNLCLKGRLIESSRNQIVVAAAAIDRANDDNNEEQQQSEEARLQREVKTKLREMVLHHPSARISPLLLRWPLLATDVPKPRWTLADEVEAVMEKRRREKSKMGAQSQEEEYLDPIESDIALPAVVSCQHALVSVLHDLAIRAQSQISKLKSNINGKREVIINWRYVLSTLSNRHDIPSPVYQATQDRLESIYGRVEFAPTPSWMAAMGMGGNDKIMETIQSNTNEPPTKWHQIRPPTQSKMNKKQQSIKRLDDILLLSSSKKRARYLESARIHRRQKRAHMECGIEEEEAPILESTTM